MAEEKTEGKQIANIIINDPLGLLKKRKLTIDESPIKPELMGFLGRAIHNGTLTKKYVKQFLIKTFEEYNG
jgi:Asp-tRNA(Asn)/Glu-tRNA(Gln) amidotransferase B subunit